MKIEGQSFKKYMHIENFKSDEVGGIDSGQCYIFPKLDGTNGLLWFDGEKLCAGSRNRELSIANDNAGFMNWAVMQTQFINFFLDVSNHYLYLFGEWLVPHTLKTYRDDAWRKFYVFDVFDSRTNEYLPYSEYSELLQSRGIDYIRPISIIENPTIESLRDISKTNTYLIKEDTGSGEGIVVKNYKYKNRFGRTTWAKIISDEHKEKRNHKSNVQNKTPHNSIENKIGNEFVTEHLINKTFAKIINDADGWNSGKIQQLIGIVYHDLIVECMWDIQKKYKKPTIDFKLLYKATVQRIKMVKNDLF